MLRTVIAVFLLFSAAYADEVHVIVGSAFRHATDVDLAALANEDGYGTGNDLSPGSLSLRVGAGYRLRDIVEFNFDGRVGIGGLALGDTELRYAGSNDTLGGSVSAEAGGHALFPVIQGDLQVLVGPGALYHIMSASSGVSFATVHSIGVGGRAGIRWRTNRIGQRHHGYLELDIDAHFHTPTYVRVGNNANPKFETHSPDGSFATFGLSLTYGFGFKLF